MTGRPIRLLSGLETVLDEAAVGRLAASLRGRLLTPESGGYDDARRVFNAAIDRRPALVARCAGVEDVVAAVRLAGERGLLTSVRGGGHGIAGHAVCEGGLVIDLSGLDRVRVDPSSRTVRAEGGVRLGDLDRATQAVSLATTMGNVSSTGIGGHTLGGGLGFLMRKLGLACDSLVSAEVVTADGGRRRASADENPDLFWGLRGGGGNFGIVTSFEYRLHPIDTVIAGPIAHPSAAVGDLLRFYRELVSAAPDELGCNARLAALPDGTPVAGLLPVWCGARREGESLLGRLRSFGTPLADEVATMPYLSLQRLKDPAYPFGLFHYWTSCLLDTLRDEVIEVLVAGGAERPTTACHVVVEALGGAVGRVAPDATAFAHRAAHFNCLVLGTCEQPADYAACVRWARELHAALRSFTTGGAYVNYLGAESPDGSPPARAAYGPRHQRRLGALKARWDPANFFRMNHNVVPAAAASGR